VPVTITRAQRDAIYEMVVNRLTGIGDVWISVDRRPPRAALGRHHDLSERGPRDRDRTGLGRAVDA
jgi:hypothetical protein